MTQAQVDTQITLEQALRQANLLVAAIDASQDMTRILDIDELIPRTVDIICDAYNFYYAGVFLIDELGEYAILKAGRGEPGRIMIENGHKLAVGGNSMIGACTALNEARISLDVDREKVWYPNPVLPKTRSEMALPLAIGDQVIGAVTVQSTDPAAFSEEDISSLQAMANHLAIALDNAFKRRELEQTHQKLVHAKTFEMIATATGDAIHWIGNKAEPIRSSVDRIREDSKLLICMMADLLKTPQLQNNIKNIPFAQHILAEAVTLRTETPEINKTIDKVSALSPAKLKKRLSLNSSLEDLQIIEDAANVILKIKEELIGPAREHAPRPAMIDDIIRDVVYSNIIPKEIVRLNMVDNLPLVLADPVQLNRVFVNLLKNAFEAMDDQPHPEVLLSARTDHNNKFVIVEVADNGCGIRENDLDKVWVTFHTTKGVKGHSGLGLSACRLILDQMGADISVVSQYGDGSIFTVKIPTHNEPETLITPPIDRKKQIKVLLVDDPDNWRNLAVSALQKAGYTVARAGKRDIIENYNDYDLIIIDDTLQGEDSLQVLERIKKANAIAKTLIFSSNPRVEQTKTRMLLGVHNVLPKPYTQLSLLADVTQSLEKIKSQP